MKSAVCLSLFVMVFVSCAGVDRSVKKDAPPPAGPVSLQSPTAPQMEKERKIEVHGRGELFSFSLRDAEVKDVLRAISKQTDYNVVMEPDVKGVCTLDIKRVTLAKALDYVLGPLDYVYKIDDRTIYVSKPKIETRVFFLNYIAMKKMGSSILRGTITTGGGGAMTGGTSASTATGATGATGAAGAMAGRAEVLSMRSDTETDMWKDVESHIQSFLSKEGKLVMNKVASTIIVSDYAPYLKRTALYLESIEGTIQRQVMIQARIVEVQLNESSHEGINWRILSGSFSNSELVTVQPSPLWGISRDAYTTTTDSSGNIVSMVSNLVPPFFRFGISDRNFEGFVELLKTQGKVKVLSNPKIATLNNQRAMIKVAREDVAFETTTLVTSGSPATTSTAIKYVTIGIMLDVTPQVDDKGNIILNIHPVVTDKVSTATSKTGDASAPIVDVRETDTMVRVKDGETVIIGGLIQEKDNISESGVPGLMNLPLIGRFFKMKDVVKLKNELVIFLTPTVIYGNEGL
jgi:MSHA biogenesis protein MshL